MHYGEIKKTDIANGVGVRVSLFVSGCRHHCEDCFNKMTWAFDYGEEYTQATEDMIIGYLSPDYIKGLTLIGCEPFEKENQDALLSLTERVKKELPHKDIWCYSGFTFEEITGKSRAAGDTAVALLKNIDVLVDGPFVEAKKDISLRFRGSSNQRLIDLNVTRAAGTVTLWKG